MFTLIILDQHSCSMSCYILWSVGSCVFRCDRLIAYSADWFIIQNNPIEYHCVTDGSSMSKCPLCFGSFHNTALYGCVKQTGCGLRGAACYCRDSGWTLVCKTDSNICLNWLYCLPSVELISDPSEIKSVSSSQRRYLLTVNNRKWRQCHWWRCLFQFAYGHKCWFVCFSVWLSQLIWGGDYNFERF